MRALKFSDGVAVVTQGAKGEETMFVIVEGILAVLIGTAGEQTEVARLGKGQVFGEMVPDPPLLSLPLLSFTVS